MQDKTKQDSVAVTQRDMMEFLLECGAGTHSVCPRCGKDDWDSATKKDAVVAEVSLDKLRSPSQVFNNFRLTFSCENCGFIENFSAVPFYKWVSKKLEMSE